MDSKLSEFSFIYTKSFFQLGAGVHNFRISYISENKELLVNNNLTTIRFDPNTHQFKSTDHPSSFKKLLTVSEEQILLESIKINNFFDYKEDYPATEQGHDLPGSYSLEIIMTGQTHSVRWTGWSLDAPIGLENIADSIEKSAGI
jgi:hypothetical protein